MPRLESELKNFLYDALEGNFYPNILSWYDKSQGVFDLKLLRKPRGRRGSTDSFRDADGIYKDWDTLKGHEYETSRSKNRLLVCMKHSSYLLSVPVSSSSLVRFQFLVTKERSVASNGTKKSKKSVTGVGTTNLSGAVSDTRCLSPLLSGNVMDATTSESFEFTENKMHEVPSESDLFSELLSAENDIPGGSPFMGYMSCGDLDSLEDYIPSVQDLELPELEEFCDLQKYLFSHD